MRIITRILTRILTRMMITMSAKYKYPTPWWKRLLVLLLLPLYPFVCIAVFYYWFLTTPFNNLIKELHKGTKKHVKDFWQIFVTLLGVVFLNRNFICEEIDQENERRMKSFFGSLPPKSPTNTEKHNG